MAPYRQVSSLFQGLCCHCMVRTLRFPLCASVELQFRPQWFAGLQIAWRPFCSVSARSGECHASFLVGQLGKSWGMNRRTGSAYDSRVVDGNKAACCTEWGTGGFPQLEYFSVFNCTNITGVLPASWTLPNLWRFDASGADFTGTGLPPQWGRQLPRLQHLEVEGCNLAGQHSSK